MNGEFTGKKRLILPILFILSGLFFIGITIWANVTGAAETGESILCVLVGVVYIAASVSLMLFNYGAYFRIEDGRVRAQFQWFRKLDCAIGEIDFVLAEINTLKLLLKNGRQYVIPGVKNSWQLSNAIRRQCFSLAAEDPEPLRQQLLQLQRTYKKSLLRVLVGICVMFLLILVAVLLTGGKDTPEFDSTDWVVLGVMGVAELATMILLFFFAQKSGKLLLPTQQLKHRLCRAIIATTPLPGNAILSVYTDENYAGRIVVCGFPNDSGVYFCVQAVTKDLSLETVHTSQVHESMDSLADENFTQTIERLIDVSAYFAK